MKRPQKIPDGIYYIVLADLLRTTKFAAETGNDALAFRTQAFIQASKKALEHAKMSSNSGQFIKSVGDGVFIAFSHFPDIIQWKLEFDGMLGLAAGHDEPFQKRICVHAGEIRFIEDDAIALAMNQIAKMEKRVKAGELVLTDIAHMLALPSIYPRQCVFEKNGTVRLAGYMRPVKLHRLVVKAEIAFLIDKTGGQRSFS